MSQKKKKSASYSGMLIAKIAAASALSWELAKLFGSAHPYLAPLSVILCMRPTVPQSLRYSLHRIVGTVIGVSFTAFLVSYLKPNAWILGLLIFAGLWIAKLLGRNQIVSEQVALTVLLVLVFEQKSEHYYLDRLRDTGIGAALALLLHMYVFPPDYKKEIKNALEPFAGRLSVLYDGAAGWVQSGCGKERGAFLKGEIKQFQQDVQQTEQALKDTSQSLKFYPFSLQKNATAAGYQERFVHWMHCYSYLESTVNTISNWHTSGCMTAVDRAAWSDQLKEIGAFFHNQEEMLRESGKQLPDPGYVYAEPVPLQVSLPEHINSPPYAIALYQDTADLIQELN